ncbi:MAG: putative rhamnosyl transferase [Antarcticimicrobium sp.]|uniref:putative rhamnosyl transferase n=1 Tax=Antarcticimicrobium sp. TaxID=2824147 RepID=UPI0026262298|nr:putative rhamnosyl transferase [Antarcticimicrobium sp.]MDF1715643.1 putative rhamnosyl transferase [Antarcticimicrobium sp.]
MQVIGICRFSYLGFGGFQIEHRDLAERAGFLYDPTRMEERFRTFETLTLPPLRAQTDDDFTLLIVTGHSLPAPYLERLHALVADMPQVVIQTHAPGKHRQVMQEAINSVRRTSKEPCLQFRMDDDDAVARVYVERLRAAAHDLRKFARNHRHIAIDFNQGYLVGLGASGLSAAPTLHPLTTAALALMLKPSVNLSVMNFAHQKLARMMPTVTLTGEDMLLRGHNAFNDSRQKPGVTPVDLIPLDPAQEALFRQVYNVDADHVRRVYSAS